mmetsp:Transcript_6363/g.7301  ORF Transcript_6363/g.7301 Transcript_6363/m.7301 type:complete len:424 (-) Transcript_6363:288-1559(-)
MKDAPVNEDVQAYSSIIKRKRELEELEIVEDQITELQEKSKKAMSYLEKFAFSSSQKSTVSETPAKPNKFAKKPNPSPQSTFKAKKKPAAASNLFVTSLDDVCNSGDEEEKSCKQTHLDHELSEDVKNYLESDEEDKQQEIDAMKDANANSDLLKDFCCLEVLNPHTHKWIMVDLSNEALISSKFAMSRAIEAKHVLFLFAVGEFEFKKPNGQTRTKPYMKEVTLKYCSQFQRMLAVKNSLYLQENLTSEIELFGSFFSTCCVDKSLALAIEAEDREIYNLERYYIPEKYNGFRSHKHFVLESLLGKYQFLRPGAKPFNGMKFKTEPIYLRSDVVNLHSKEQWKRLRREVRHGEKPVKKVKGNYNDKDKMAHLFGSWQTDVFECKLNPDGSLPANEHGNIEVRSSHDVPKGARHLRIKRGKFI